MKTKEQLQAAVDELRIVCAKHEIVLFGVCSSVYGEIAISENTPTAAGWRDVAAQIDNRVGFSDGGFHVNGIGNLICKS